MLFHYITIQQSITNKSFDDDIILSFLFWLLSNSWNWIRLFEIAKDRISSKPKMVQSIQKLVVNATFPGMVLQGLSQDLMGGFQAILTGKVESIEKHPKDRKHQNARKILTCTWPNPCLQSFSSLQCCEHKDCEEHLENLPKGKSEPEEDWPPLQSPQIHPCESSSQN